MWENLGGKKLANRKLFSKTFPHQLYLSCSLTLAYLLNFSLPIAFTCMAYQKFSCVWYYFHHNTGYFIVSCMHTAGLQHPEGVHVTFGVAAAWWCD